MADRSDVWQGTLALMVLKTLEAMGPLPRTHGLLGAMLETREWTRTTAILERFLVPREQPQ